MCEGRYYIFCPEIKDSTLTIDGTSLLAWFHHDCRPLAFPMELTHILPEGAIRLPERSFLDQVQRSGEPLNMIDFKATLALELGKDFPSFEIKEDHNSKEFIIYVESLPDEKHKENLKKAFEVMKSHYGYRIEVNPNFLQKNKLPEIPMPFIRLVSSRYFPEKISKNLIDLLQKDEGFWVDNRERILTSHSPDLSESLDAEWVCGKSRCFIDCTLGDPINLRNYLTIYNKIFILMPYRFSHEQIFEKFHVKDEELLELIRKGVVRLILPGSLDLFNLRFLDKVANECPVDSMLLSRQLAGLTVMESRRRMPFFYPPLAVDIRQLLLSEILSIAEKMDEKDTSKYLFSMQKVLSDIWANEHALLHNQGAMAIGQLGFGRLIGDILHHNQSVDRRIEFYRLSSSVEFAGALSASLVLGEGSAWQLKYVELLASIYSGVPGSITPDFSSKLADIAVNLFSIDNDMPIVELANVLKDNHDINSIKKIVNGLSTENLDKLPELISNYNRSIKVYEKREAKLRKFNILGLTGILFLDNAPLYVSLGLWTLGVLLNHLPKDSHASKIVDSLCGIATLSHPNTVLISKFQRKIASVNGI